MQIEAKNPADYILACTTQDERVLAALRTSACSFVRSRVAAKTRKGLLLAQLIDDADSGVLINILQNPTCSEYLVDQIALRMVNFVQESRKFEDAAGIWTNVWRVLLAHELLSWELKVQIEKFLLQNDKKKSLPVLGYRAEERAALAQLQEPKTMSPREWQVFANHWSWRVRIAVINREDCPTEILKSFLKDANWVVYTRAWYKLFVQLTIPR
jgi:hypothetical protein